MSKNIAPVGAPQVKPIGKNHDINLHFSLSFSFDELFKSRLLFLVISLVLLALSALMFARADLRFADLFDFGRMQFLTEKIISISLILYVVLFSLALASAAYFGLGLKKLQALLLLPASILIAGVFCMLFPIYAYAFVAMAFAVSTAAFAATFAKEPTFQYASAAISRALFVFLCFAVIFSLITTTAQKDALFDQFLGGATSMMPELQQQVAPVLAGAVQGAIQDITIDENAIKNSIDKTQIRTLVAANYDAQRLVFINATKAFIAEDALAGLVKPFASLSTAEQDGLVNSYYNYAVNKTLVAANALKTQLLSQLQLQQAQQANASNATALPSAETKPAITAAQLKQIILGSNQFRTIYDFFPFILTAAIAAIVSLLHFFVRLIGTFFAWVLFKVQP